MSTSYPTNLTDAEWENLQRHLLPLSRHSRPPTHSLRTIFDAIFYVLRTGCPWRYLPGNFPRLSNRVLPFSALARSLAPGFTYSLHCGVPNANGSAGTDSLVRRSWMPGRVKTVEESAGICGFDAHTCVNGHKRHILVDTLGLRLSVYVTPADLHKSQGARCLLAGLAPLLPRLKKIWADAACRCQELAQWCLAQGNWDLEVVERLAGTPGFSALSAGSWSARLAGSPALVA